MNELQRLIEEIQSVLAADADPEPAQVESLETAYVAAVLEVNERLRECERLLRSGHQGEAIQRCEVEPNLLDMAALLDFSESAQWADYVVQFALAPPPRLRAELAGELNEAYAAIEPLKDLLRQHRLHALARSPVSVRISILRRIADIDNGNPIWDQDIRSFERARIAQVRQELPLCVQQRSVQRIAQLDQELRSTAWRERPPKAIIAQAADAHRRLLAEKAHGELEDVAQELIKAFAAFDVPAGRALRDRFTQLRAVAELPLDDPLVDATSPALDWLDTQDARDTSEREHEAALARLAAAAGGGVADREELVRLRDLARRDEHELPPDLEDRVGDRIRLLDRTAIRKRRLVIAGVAGCVILAGSLVGAAVVFHQRSVHVTESVKRLDELLEMGSLAEADLFAHELEERSPSVFANAEVQKRSRDLAIRLREDEERRATRLEALRTAERGGLKKVNWDSLDQADAQGKRAEELSKTDPERLEARELLQKLQDRRREMEMAENREFDQRLLALKSRLTAANGNDKPALQSVHDQLQELEQGPRINEQARKKVQHVIEQAQSFLDQLDERERRRLRMAKITAQLGSPERYLAALRSYAKEFPVDERSAGFQRVFEKEGVVLVAMRKWNKLIHEWSAIDFTSIRPPDAEALLKESQELIGEMSYHPAAKRVEEYRKILQVVQERVKPDGTPTYKDLEAVLNYPVVRSLYYVRETKGQRYYCTDQPSETENRCKFSYVKTRDLKKSSRKSFDRKELKPLDEEWRSPQWLFARHVDDLLAALDRRGWEATFYDVLSSLSTDPEMEPILKLELLKATLPVARVGSSFFREKFQDMETSIQAVPIDYSVNWIDPDDSDAKKVREQAEAMLNRLPVIKSFAAPLNDYLARLRKPSFGPIYDWCGWLYRDPKDSRWICVVDEQLVARTSKPLFAFVSAPNGSLLFEQIGMLAEGHAMLSVKADLAIEEGRPVFFENGRKLSQ